MSLNSGNFDEELYEARRQEAIKQAQEMINNARNEGEKPVSDEEFQKLAEENLKNKWNSLEWWQFIERTRMYV
jgi:F0F1-type ATP synthase membrane subunit b/b'